MNQNRSTYRPYFPLILISLCLLFLGVNGIVGGYLMITDPNGTPMGMSVTDLAYTPFHNFFIPGLLLLGIWGCGSFVTLAGLWLRPQPLKDSLGQGIGNEHWAWVFCLLIGVGLFVWLLVQLFTIPTIAPIQFILFALAVVLIGLPLTGSVRRYYRLQA
jgi:hypothetical protein